MLLVSLLVLSQVPTVLAQESVPEKRIFYVSAYYSPLPGQSFYLRGDLEKEKRLNGNGVRGASGKAVYPGMLAAPKSYPFGTKIKLEGVGVGTVTDRGGAIVAAGQRGNSYDRIDIWVGSGEEGLKRALSWGLRKVVGYVYPAGTEMADTVEVENLKIAKIAWPKNSSFALFKRNLGEGDTGEDVNKLQEVLLELGYLEQDPGEKYESKTIDAVYRFQVDAGILKSAAHTGAGYTGEKTRQALEKKWYEVKEQQRKEEIALTSEKQKLLNGFPVQLGKKNGSKSDITVLQNALQELGYDVPVSGTYDQQTLGAVIAFQQEKGIIAKKSDYGAGFFGNQTKLAFVEKLWDKRRQEKVAQVASSSSSAQVPPAAVPEVKKTASLSKVFDQDLDNKSKGETVLELQNALRELGWLEANGTGYYGPKTQEAVLAFQMKYKLVGTKESPGAGIFGPLTRGKFKQIWNQYQDKKLTQELDVGDKGVTVTKLQNTLQKLGYFQEKVTGTFGNITKEALVKFQIDAELIENASSLGAGRVGQATLKLLNEKLITLL